MEKIMNKLSVQLGDFADEIKEQADYYAHTEEGRVEIQEAAKQAGRVACETGKFLWAVAGGIANGITRKTKNCYKAGRHMYHGEYMEAGKTIADMEVKRFKAIGKTLVQGAGAISDGALLALSKEEKNGDRKKRFKKRLKKCAVAGGVMLAGIELLDDEEVGQDADYDDFNEGLPLTAVDDMPGVENGVLVDASPENLTALAQQGEFTGTIHYTDVIRHPDIRADFLASHGFSETPIGWEVHHIVPLSEGGADSPDNMILLREQDHAWITAQHRQFYGWHEPEYWQAYNYDNM